MIETLLYSWDNVPTDDKFDELCKLQRQAGGPNTGTPGPKNATKEFSILTKQHLLDKAIDNNNDNNNDTLMMIIMVMMIKEKDVYT